MKFYFFLLIILLINISCSNKDDTQEIKFHFDKPATVIINCVADDTIQTIMSRHAAFFPTDYVEGWINSEVISVTNGGSYDFNYNISTPTEPYLIINDTLELPIFIIPCDTLKITLNFTTALSILQKISFQGKTDKINEYLLKRYIKFKDSLENKRGELIRANLSVIPFQKSVDSIYSTEINFLNAYNKHKILPQWFVLLKANELRDRNAFEKTYQINYRRWYLKTNEKEPDGYFDYLKTINIQNDDATVSFYYNFFLYEYFKHLLFNKDKKLDLETRRKNFLHQHFNMADSLLIGEVKDIYKTFVVHLLISVGQMEGIDSLLNNADLKFLNSKYLEYLKGFYKYKTSLSLGTKAPAFYLPNTENEYKNLSDFDGKIILLNFWFPGCKGCEMEIPYEEELINKFGNQDFQLVNICFFSSEKNWKNFINKYQMKGAHLFANANWQKKLVDSYKISSYPHYTLIDKVGKVIENNCKQPSEGIERDIMESLNK